MISMSSKKSSPNKNVLKRKVTRSSSVQEACETVHCNEDKTLSHSKRRRLGDAPRSKNTKAAHTENPENADIQSELSNLQEADNKGIANNSKSQSSETEVVNSGEIEQSCNSNVTPCKDNERTNTTGQRKKEIFGRYIVQEKSDKQTCDILDICQLVDGGFLIADRYNKKLKRLDKAYKLNGSIRLKEVPNGVCAVSLEEGAVSLVMLKKVNIISLGKKMKLIRSFKTSYYCRGMVCYNNMLYVCCGDVTDSSSGCIEVFTKSGQIQHRITDVLKQSSLIPVNIGISDDGEHLLYTSCNSDAITVIDLAGNIVTTLVDKNLQVPSRLCTDGRGQVYICGTNNNNVSRFCIKSDKIQAIVSETDGVKTPIGICVDVKQQRLIVSCDRTNELLVFNLLNSELQ